MHKLIVFLFSCLTLCLLPQMAQAENFNVKMQGIDGERHALREYLGKGKWTIVNVWSAQCPYCRHELPEVSEFHDAHADKDAMIIGLTTHLPDYGLPESDTLKQFTDSYLVEFPVLLVTDEIVHKVIDRPFHGVPVFYIYNPEGKFVKRIDGMVTKADLEAAIQP